MNTTTPDEQPVTGYAGEKDLPVIELETAAVSVTEDRKLLRRIDWW